MKKVKFEICNTRTRTFTTTQQQKVNTAIDILQKVWASPTFKKQVKNYTWNAADGTMYKRFHLSKGMSNTQVWDCLESGWNWFTPNTNSKTTWTINIVPCCTRNEVVACVTPTGFSPSIIPVPTTTGNPAPTIWINTAWVNDDNCTPIHIAACIIHEWCVACGFTACCNGQRVWNWQNTVPYACGTIVMDVCRRLAAKNKTIAKYWKAVCKTTCNYFACSTEWCFDTLPVDGISPCVKIDEVIGFVECEMEWLSSIGRKNRDEVNRWTTLSNTLSTLNEMKQNLVRTSLDGCETVGAASVNTVQLLTVN